MKDKRIYSLNKLAYLLANNVKLDWQQENNIYYATVDQDITQLMEDYKNNTFLHNYLNRFKEVKFKIKELRLMSQLENDDIGVK